MRRVYSWQICLLAAALMGAGAMTPAKAQKPTAQRPPGPDVPEQAAGSGISAAVVGAGGLEVMSRIDLSQQVASQSAVAEPKGTGRNQIILMDERGTKTNPNAVIVPDIGFLVIGIRQSTGIGNNQVNAAQIHTP